MTPQFVLTYCRKIHYIKQTQSNECRTPIELRTLAISTLYEPRYQLAGSPAKERFLDELCVHNRLRLIRYQ